MTRRSERPAAGRKGKVSVRVSGRGPGKVSHARVPTPIVALDVPTAGDAVRLVEQLGRDCRFYKVGSELFTAAGPAIVDYLRVRGAEVFLDLKLHDIPNTVERAAAVAAATGVRLLTVHAVGGADMIEAAVFGARAGAARAGTTCDVLAVTVLTSLAARDVGAAWGRRLGAGSVSREVLRLTELALKARARGVVCSGEELVRVRRRFGGKPVVLVPGVRRAGGRRGDQVRVVTPHDAAAGGADYVVFGRAVTQARDPAAELDSLLQELRAGQRSR